MAGKPKPFGFGPVTSQYHSQDEFGQYAYGYSGGPSAKHEQRTADGVTQGGYSYVDANGIVQSMSYVSDPVNGFRVAGTNLPVDANSAPVPLHHAAMPVVHDVPAVHSWAPATVMHSAVPAMPSVVDARLLAEPVVPAAPLPTMKLAKALTPAGTSNLHYPEHPVYLAARKKRSADLYPMESAYATSVAHHAAPVHAPVATSYTRVVRHESPTVHYAPAPIAYAPAPILRHYAPAPAPLVYAPAPVVRHYAPAPAPIVYAAAPEPAIIAAPEPAIIAAPAPAVVTAPVKSQYHVQDDFGQYTYGYTDGESAKTETRYADGTTKGSYSYVDDNGAVQAMHYTADADGFRAAGTNIPVHHV